MVILLPYFRLKRACSTALGPKKTLGLTSLVVDEAENMSHICVSSFTKSYSFYDTHDILNDVNELRYQRKHLYYFQEIQQRSN